MFSTRRKIGGKLAVLDSTHGFLLNVIGLEKSVRACRHNGICRENTFRAAYVVKHTDRPKQGTAAIG